MSEPALYADRDHMAQGEHYLRHVSAMTGEGLHAKSAIAAELAHRDIQIAALTAERDALRAVVLRASTLYPSIDDTAITQRDAHELRRAACAAIDAARAQGSK